MDEFFEQVKGRSDLLFNYYIDTINPMVKTVEVNGKEQAEILMKYA